MFEARSEDIEQEEKEEEDLEVASTSEVPPPRSAHEAVKGLKAALEFMSVWESPCTCTNYSLYWGMSDRK